MEKLPAPQPTKPVKTSAFWLMKVFWAQKSVRHWVVRCVSLWGGLLWFSGCDMKTDETY